MPPTDNCAFKVDRGENGKTEIFLFAPTGLLLLLQSMAHSNSRLADAAVVCQSSPFNCQSSYCAISNSITGNGNGTNRIKLQSRGRSTQASDSVAKPLRQWHAEKHTAIQPADSQPIKRVLGHGSLPPLRVSSIALPLFSFFHFLLLPANC